MYFTCGKQSTNGRGVVRSNPFVFIHILPYPTQVSMDKVFWDKLQDYQKIKTALVRSTVDYSVQKNTIRIIADPKKISTRDLKSGRPGIIKAKAWV